METELGGGSSLARILQRALPSFRKVKRRLCSSGRRSYEIVWMRDGGTMEPSDADLFEELDIIVYAGLDAQACRPSVPPRAGMHVNEAGNPSAFGIFADGARKMPRVLPGSWQRRVPD